MRRRFLVLPAAIVVTALAVAQAADVVVRKTAANANPSLCLASFDGPGDIQQRLAQALTACDWFTVVPDPARAMYVLRARYGGGASVALEMELTQAGGAARVFRVSGSPGQKDWMVYRAVDSLITELFRNPGLCASRIAFAVGTGRSKEIFACNFDGTGTTQLTHNGTISTEPSWGPGAASLVYTVYGSSWTDVALLDLGRMQHRRLSQFPGLNASADISPGADAVALCLSRDRTVELYVMRVRDTSLTRLTRDPAVESSPTWSPDGSTICFVSDRARVPQLYLVGRGGGAARALTSGGAECVSPDWSGVSNRICFATKRGGEYAIAVIDMNDPTRQKKVVTNAAGSWESPSWAPDGRHLICTRRSRNKAELCIVDTSYGRIRTITGAGDLSLPSWSDLH